MQSRFRQNPSVEAAPMHEETVLFDPSGNRFCLLNSTAAFLWERLKTPSTTEQLTAALCTSFDGVDPATAAQDVQQALTQFAEYSFVLSDS